MEVSYRKELGLFSCWGMDTDTKYGPQLPLALACRGQGFDVAQSSGLPWPPRPPCPEFPSCLALPLSSVLLRGSSLQLYIRWAVGESFLSRPSDREVKQPHLVGLPDLWVTEEVAMQTARERELLCIARL